MPGTSSCRCRSEADGSPGVRDGPHVSGPDGCRWHRHRRPGVHESRGTPPALKNTLRAGLSARACWPSVETTGCKTGIIVVPDSAPTSRQTPIKGNGRSIQPRFMRVDSRSNGHNPTRDSLVFHRLSALPQRYGLAVSSSSPAAPTARRKPGQIRRDGRWDPSWFCLRWRQPPDEAPPAIECACDR